MASCRVSVSLTVDGQPFILVLPLRQFHHLAQTPSAECRLCILSQLVARGAAFAWRARSELIPRPLVSAVQCKSECHERRDATQPTLDHGGIDSGRFDSSRGGETNTVVRNELIAAVGVEDAMNGDASELLRVQEPELAGYSLRERGARGSVAKTTMLTDAIRGTRGRKRMVAMFGWSTVSPKCLMQVQETGVWAVGVARRHDANVGECLQHRKSALALATGIAAGNCAGSQSQGAMPQVLAFPS